MRITNCRKCAFYLGGNRCTRFNGRIAPDYGCSAGRLKRNEVNIKWGFKYLLDSIKLRWFKDK